jgi:hypothetical protein
MTPVEGDINSVIGKVITRSHAIEKLLRAHYKVTGRGLHKAIDELSNRLPAVLTRILRIIAIVRNAAAHPDKFTLETAPSDFDRLCNEIEILIPFFASRDAKPSAPAGKQPHSTTTAVHEAKGSRTIPAKAAPAPVVTTEKPLNQSKPWTAAEERQLLEGFDSKVAIPDLAKALNRGIGGVQRKLIKLGKLAEDAYRNYPADTAPAPN